MGRRIGCAPTSNAATCSGAPYIPRPDVTTTRNCATCGTEIIVTTRNPNRRYSSQRCRSAHWHACNRGTINRVANHVVNNVADPVPPPPNALPDAVRAANGVTRCPHCRHELAVIAVVIPADATHVRTPEVIT